MLKNKLVTMFKLTEYLTNFCLFLLLDVISSQGYASGLRLLKLQAPSQADPRNDLSLDCLFDMGSEELYSVKWYKDDQEFFRYTPSQHPPLRSFPVAGVHLVRQGGNCTNNQCSVHLTQLTSAHSGGSYRCEVSTEAPTFRVVFETANVTVAAVGRHDPIIVGVKSSYVLADLVYGNCTTAPADPAPMISWLINGKPAPAISLGQPKTSQPNEHGLVVKSMMLRFHADRRHFPEPTSTMELKCVASMPGVLAKDLVTTVTSVLNQLEQNAVSQKLELANSYGMNYILPYRVLLVATTAILCFR